MALPSTPMIDPKGISYGLMTVRPTMSQPSTNAAPSNAVQGIALLTLSPIIMLTTFGTTSPTNGTAPTVATTDAVTRATMLSPTTNVRR